MGDGITHEGPPLQGHVAGEQAAHRPHQGTDAQGTHHEFMAERLQHPIH